MCSADKKISIRAKNIMIEIKVLVEKTKTKKPSVKPLEERCGGKRLQKYKNTG